MRVKDAVGRFGEQLAVEHLLEAGLCILERNWRCPAGELDIVARDGSALVFVEVKTRTSAAFGDPAEAIGPAKATRIRGLALRWVAERRGHQPREHWAELRFDVVAVLRRGPQGPSVRHVRAAF